MECLLCKRKISLIISDTLRNEEKGKVYFCRKCKLGILDNKHSLDDLRIFYRKDYRKTFKPKLHSQSSAKELFDIYSRFQEGRIRLIKRYLGKKKRLLEIGCSAGMFLSAVKKYVQEVVGIDYDTNSAHFASKKCSCRVFDKDIASTGLKKESFDIICLFQVLEHLQNPKDFLDEIKHYLKPGGVIYIEVPNLHDALIYAYNLPKHYQFYFHRAHLCYFTNESLMQLVKKAGFSGKIYFSQDYNLLNHLHWIDADTPQKDCLAGLSIPELPLRGSLDYGRAEKLRRFMRKVDADYKRLLGQLGIASNISFIGRKAYGFRERK